MSHRFTALKSHRTLAFATASSVAFLAAFYNCSEEVIDDDNRCEQKVQDRNKLLTWQTLRMTFPIIGTDIFNTVNHSTCRTVKCEEAALNHTTTSAHNESNKPKQSLHGMDYYYLKMNPDDMFEASELDSHAIFGPLLGADLIERFNVYKRVNTIGTTVLQESKEQPDKNEIAVVDIKLGTSLNGHGGVVHGGIISLLLDTALGYAYHVLLHGDKDNIAVTANLNINFRAPFREGSEAVVRVYLDKIDGRKIFFSVVLESKDGSVVYAEATSLFIKVGRSKVVKND